MVEEVLWAILTIILLAMAFNGYLKAKSLPPGPFPLPIIGNLLKVATDSRHIDLMKMEKQYGHVFRLYLGSQLVVIVSGEEAIKEVLVTRSGEFAGRPNVYTGEVYSQGKAIAMTDYSPQWRLHRKITVSALKTYMKEVLNESKVIEDEFDLLLTRVSLWNGRPHDIAREIRLAVMNVICALAFGSRYELDDPEFSRILEMTTAVAKMLASGSLVDVFPWMWFLPFKATQALKRSGQERDELIGRIYWEHVQANRVQHPRDLADTLIKAKKEAEDEDKSVKGFLTDEHLIFTLSEVFMAGLETTSSTLCWILLYLIHYPSVQDRVHQELDEVIGNSRLPDLADKKNLPYLEATIAESLRVSSLVPLAVPHKATVDTSLQGYHIPKGTTVLVNLWSLHHDPEIWDDPNEFKPERFLDDNGLFQTPKVGVLLPFSGGRRVCLGESFARMQLFFVLARLLHSFKFENPPSCDLPTLQPDVGIVLMPQSFKVCAVKRHIF
ncbi:steroid 17-alpha-hydroxylase/17,20 lyase-like [Montipora capricornis]|uniref:steroid 17-alpha-hydroxylase/17,20 lyase-like n=1 Tax=Montipora capricornis TaxID=246305 RepID=UPI0035F12E7B